MPYLKPNFATVHRSHAKDGQKDSRKNKTRSKKQNRRKQQSQLEVQVTETDPFEIKNN